MSGVEEPAAPRVVWRQTGQTAGSQPLPVSRPGAAGVSLRLGADRIAAVPGRVPGLDGLRALSIAIVVAGHFFLSRHGGGFAAVGVYIFFVISGFIITRLMFLELKQHGSLRVGAFYRRRAIRLLPALVLYMLVMVLLATLFGAPAPLGEIGSVFFYYSNYLMTWDALHGTEHALPIGAFWSLSVEEHFYLLAPLVFVAVRGSVKSMLIFAVSACLVPLLIRMAYVACWPDIVDHLVTYRNSETRFDSIAFGVLLAVLCESRLREDTVRVLSSWAAALAGLVLIGASLMVGDTIFKETIRFSLLSLGCVPLVCAVVFGNRMGLVQRLANAPVVVWIGRLSYSIYVWHLGIAYVADHLGLARLGHGRLALLDLAASLVAALISYVAVEQPSIAASRRGARSARRRVPA